MHTVDTRFSSGQQRVPGLGQNIQILASMCNASDSKFAAKNANKTPE